MQSKDIAIIAVFCTAIVGMLMRPVFLAWARRLSGGAVNADLAGEVDELRHRVIELEAEHGRMQELEERVDFAERMLAQRADAQAIVAPRMNA
jgi:hypothetical protein